ncbi:histidine phosphatase family protein [Micromonospora sp. NPDC049171]|uniref:histidine phosphatase family protein n=1 Tax=Micromonospora sp. NPDC049171 TaxID=3155770 RepID=UPI0033D83009
MYAEVVLVRHAVSVQPTADGPHERTRPLTPTGLGQARDLVDALVEPCPAAVWSSPYLRAVQTVQPTAHALGQAVHTWAELREWDDGLPFTTDWEPHYERSWAEPSFARPGGESLDQVTIRAVAAVRALAATYPGRCVVAASHSTLIARALGGLGVAVDWFFERRMPMPAVYRLRFTDRSARPTIRGPYLDESA